ncbi:SET domain-containing protein [Cristinia sonorae]|uniref:SET domain-containing protein n=1 Tax=Cristinia sonorae TaxID=1940300 RepID=A0A8K0XVM3_9AGAR|nr:SET domain-containing protein [Cristinia sonorae]
MDDFVGWFQSQNGVLDTTVMGLGDIPGHGRGAYALTDIPEGHTLFTIPRNLTLSTRTSSLPKLLGKQAWKEFKLHVGWAGLILCMMWEEEQGEKSRWSGYLADLPSTFDTPMFWTSEELKELQGTAVVDKIGRDDAERDYREKLMPAALSRPDLFPSEKLLKYYTLERYHVMGSRILSRSFTVLKWNGMTEDEDAMVADADTSIGSGMDVDMPDTPDEPQLDGTELQEDDDEESEDEDMEDPGDVSMVPMADMLNARFESENAKLFYEEHELKMITTKAIKAGEQIWNTYGDPPNSDLLRRYGHVDLVPLRTPLSGMGNPADVVEVRADLVVTAVNGAGKAVGDSQERVDWWLEFTDDDTFVIQSDCDVPDELISLVLLLMLPAADWTKTQRKQKLPKAKLNLDIIPIISSLIERRLAEYPTSIQEDETLLRSSSLSVNKRNAVIVRLGEKYILAGTLAKLQVVANALREVDKKPKRKADSQGDGRKGKKTKS